VHNLSTNSASGWGGGSEREMFAWKAYAIFLCVANCLCLYVSNKVTTSGNCEDVCEINFLVERKKVC
jgi:hypothetical protein